ncbi:E3 ubiquitin-protein ligase TRIM35-like [Alosa pseudoharengus]|uniref:E3 ubiquitin-protein ligase TRIM35-like n=1 Tax=Alosa pseudoharengus TaxID=34774 RepID=UPI003F8A2F38
MASSLSEEDFSCPVCFGVFKNPVMLTCSHSFCESCVRRCWEASGSRECPACRNPSHDLPRPNLVLKNLCEKFLQQMKALAEMCQLHNKKLEFFCWDDEQPICVMCRDAETHSNHRVCPIEKLSCKRKSTLEAKLQPLRKKLKAFQEAKLIYERTAKHIESQAKDVEEGIEGVLNDFLGFLGQTKRDKMRALKVEKRSKILMVEEKKRADREISSLTSTLESTEEAMGADITTFLRDYEETEGRIQCTLQDPESVSGVLIDVPKHLGNLRLSVWEEMQNLVTYFPILLNPNTASKHGIVCPDLIELGAPDPATAAAAVANGNNPDNFPDHPGRFDFRNTVLGSEGFDSGTHCWEVEVGDSTEWCVGVMAESAQRKGDFTSRSGVWYLARWGERHEACCPPNRPVAVAVDRLWRVRVQLDWERGELSFSSPWDPDAHLHTFTHTFTERVFPVCSGDKYLAIAPGDVSVKLQTILSG